MSQTRPSHVLSAARAVLLALEPLLHHAGNRCVVWATSTNTHHSAFPLCLIMLQVFDVVYRSVNSCCSTSFRTILVPSRFLAKCAIIGAVVEEVLRRVLRPVHRVAGERSGSTRFANFTKNFTMCLMFKFFFHKRNATIHDANSFVLRTFCKKINRSAHNRQ